MRNYELLRKRTCKTKNSSDTHHMGIAVICALILLAVTFLLPLALFGGGAPVVRPTVTPDPVSTLPPQPVAATAGESATIRVKLEGGTVETMPLSDYLFRVLSAEMPASFELEALKAQTVAVRTYALRKQQLGEPNHPDADVCSDINCCQAYLNPAASAAAWGATAELYTAKIAQAVAETSGVVATYGGALIQAVFFSSTVTATNDAVSVWGNAVPYLVGTSSPEGEGDVPGYHSNVVLTADEFKTRFLAQYPQATLGENPQDWFGAVEHSVNGAVQKIVIGGVLVPGAALRTLCELRSQHFTVIAGEHAVTFDVLAYGHGVGMSQYGANVMAEGGADYMKILQHYYTGIEVG